MGSVIKHGYKRGCLGKSGEPLPMGTDFLSKLYIEMNIYAEKRIKHEWVTQWIFINYPFVIQFILIN